MAGYYIFTASAYSTPALVGEIDIAGLQPTAARDNLQGGHARLLDTLVRNVQDALFKVLRDFARAGPGMLAIVGEENAYIKKQPALCSTPQRTPPRRGARGGKGGTGTAGDVPPLWIPSWEKKSMCQKFASSD